MSETDGRYRAVYADQLEHLQGRRGWAERLPSSHAAASRADIFFRPDGSDQTYELPYSAVESLPEDDQEVRLPTPAERDAERLELPVDAVEYVYGLKMEQLRRLHAVISYLPCEHDQRKAGELRACTLSRLTLSYWSGKRSRKSLIRLLEKQGGKSPQTRAQKRRRR